MRTISILLCVLQLATPVAALADTLRFTVISGGANVGHLTAQSTGLVTHVDFDVKDNGRGPTLTETIALDAAGLPTRWEIKGTTTFGSKVRESFARSGSRATWLDSTGPGSARPAAASLYVAQGASPWADGVYAHALLGAGGGELPALPGGTLRLEKGEAVTVQGEAGPLTLTHFDIIGIDTTPEMVLMDAAGSLFATVEPGVVVVRAGYEGEERRLRELAAKWSADRARRIEQSVAHRYPGPVRIRNVRVFDPTTSSLTEPLAVVVMGNRVAALEPLESVATPGEFTIDGGGGTLVAGMFDMHAHLQQDEALLDVAAGITAVRDMGNDNAVLDGLIGKIDSGELGGPHVIRSGFIEGKSPYSANNGILVDSQAAALDAVRWYAARGYWQIKIYNSMNPAWVPAMTRESHLLGMRVAGHVPAFATADQMIEAGYDEVTHINQFMLGWVIQPTEDTRTLFRLTALKRFGGIDLMSDKVQRTVGMMVDRHIAIDPTLGIHEMITQNRDGHTPPGAVDYLAHLPIGARRNLLKALIDASAPGDDAAYRAAFEKILATVRLLHDRGVFMVFGTDTGGSFTYHREIELYQRAGMTPSEIIKRATYDSARYLGRDQDLGSIEKGKLADFFLIPGDPTRQVKAVKTISLVAKDGVFYFPAEIYPHFGIQPFIAAPRVTAPAAAVR